MIMPFKLNDVLLYLFLASIHLEYWDLVRAGPFSVAFVTGIVYSFSFVLFNLPRFLRNWNKSVKQSTLLVLFTFYVIYSTATLFNPQYLTDFDSVFSITLLQCLVMFVLVSTHIIRQRIMEPVLRVMWLTVLLMGVLQMIGYGYDVSLSGFKRVSFFGENPNNYAAKAVLGSIIGLYFIQRDNKEGMIMRLLYLLSLILFFRMIYESASRSGLVMYVVSVFLYFLLSRLSLTKRVIGVILGVYIVLLGLRFVLTQNNSLMQARLSLVTSGESYGERDLLVEQSFDAIMSNILTGVSRIPLTEYGIYRDPHNVYLAVFLAGGLFAFMAFVSFNVDIIKRSFHVYRINSNSLYLVLVIIINLDMIQSGGLISHKRLWLVYAIVYAGSRISQRKTTWSNENIIRK